MPVTSSLERQTEPRGMQPAGSLSLQSLPVAGDVVPQIVKPSDVP